MFCSSCGKQLPDGAKFCRYCGATQPVMPTAAPRSAPPVSAPPPASPPSFAQGSSSAPPPSFGQGAPSAAPTPTPAKKPGSRFGMIASVAIIAVVGYVIFFWDPAAEPTSAPTSQPSFSYDESSSTVVLSPSVTPAPAAPAPAADARIPNYQPTNPRWETLRYEWYCLNGTDVMWLELPIDVEMYNHYRGLERYMTVGELYHYMDDANNRAMIRDIVRVIQDVGNDLSYTDMDMIREVVKFVQDVIEYEYDITSTGEIEYPRYPIETLYERRGDCEDTSILMAAMLRELGYEVGFLHLPKHLAVAVRAVDDYADTAYYEIDGKRYVYIESTGSGWNIGDIPEDFLETEAEFFPIA